MDDHVDDVVPGFDAPGHRAILASRAVPLRRGPSPPLRSIRASADPSRRRRSRSRQRRRPRREELAGVQAAADFVNADGGVDGRAIVLDVRDLEAGERCTGRHARAQGSGALVVVGAYSSAPVDPGEPGGERRRARVLGGRARWPTSSPVAACRSSSGSARAARTSARTRRPSPPPSLPRGSVGRRRSCASPSSPRTTTTRDRSRRPRWRPRRARARRSSTHLEYDLMAPDFPGVMRQLGAAKPDVIILASHIPDGVAFRRAMVDCTAPRRCPDRIDDGRMRP